MTFAISTNIARRSYFNSHTREGVTGVTDPLIILFDDFNSHTREGVTFSSDLFAVISDISTHTPVRV